MGLKVQVLGFGIWGVGFVVLGLRFGVVSLVDQGRVQEVASKGRKFLDCE